MTDNCPQSNGFTLIELAIAVVVVAILAAIALPSYRTSVQKSRRTEGKVLLQTIMAAEERYYANVNRYTSEAGQSGLGVSTESMPGRFYALSTISLSEGDQAVVLTVAPQHAQADDPCGGLTLDSAGRRGVAATEPESLGCW